MRHFLLTIATLLFILPLGVFAQEGRITFHSLPGLSSGDTFTTEQYINALYTLAISLAAILAVIKLIWAGVQYMLTDIVTSKQKAKDDIKGALLGLMIILAAVTILNTINPNLTNLNFLRNAEQTAPLQSGGDNVPPTYEQTNAAYIDAQNSAEKCGGTFVKKSDGNFVVTCPGEGPSTPSNQNNQQMAGWPITVTGYGEYLAALNQCRQAGGSPDGEETSTNSNQYNVRCFR